MPLAASVSTPPLLEGDSLMSDEFLRLWEEMPDVKHAELIDGIVYMPSPVSRNHGDFQLFLGGWLGFYMLVTPGCRASAEATWERGSVRFRSPTLPSESSPSTADKPESPASTPPVRPS